MPKKYSKKYKKYSGSSRYRNYSRGLGQLYKDVMMLKTLINVEKKYIDTASAGTTLAAGTTGTVVPLSLVAQGTDNINRIGDSIKYTSIEVEGFVSLNVATQDFIKIAVILDRQVNGALPNFANIYDLNTVTAAIAKRSRLTVDRYSVLKVFEFPLNSNGEQTKKFKAYIKCPLGTDYHQKHNNTGGAITDIYSNAIYLAFGGNNTANMSVINYNCRVRFVDN